MAFKPNIYPIMYWALAYGFAAALLLVVVFLLSSFITLVWFPVFLVGLVLGGWRNYRKQKVNWEASTGTVSPNQGAMGEFREAVSDIAGASQELFNQDAAAEEQIVGEEVIEEELSPTDEQMPPPSAPTPPPIVPPTT